MVDEAQKRQARLAVDEIIDRHGTLREVSIAYVRYVLACMDENRLRAAMRLGLDRRTIQRWVPRQPRGYVRR